MYILIGKRDNMLDANFTKLCYVLFLFRFNVLRFKLFSALV